ncbi:hypothetical protein LB553_02450 [Mesorhizobium sp. CA8]|uniref:hypothetical protein n=1 Tax=unclassified Mesorhizobium TaxID=325217 RepID=UPI001CC96505|nr:MULTISPECIES: hypothetical protein [unclassified Mesorhizobium]MBZ9759745.1 hypothetical protein [Mesorhizobium sp. CA8]MBZ9819722.1 hypothetical protein [Mesorhizobium sp. CA4]
MAQKIREALLSEQEPSGTTLDRSMSGRLDSLTYEDAPSRMLELARKLDTAIALRARKAKPS